MKKVILLASLLLLISINISAQNQEFETEWAKVDKLETQDLPKSANAEVETILQKALKEKNAQQVIKALLHKNKYKRAIDNQNIDIFQDLKNLLLQTNNKCEQALLHSILAELYADYYITNMWQLNQRSALSDVVPDNMLEWSSNTFIDQAIDNTAASVVDFETLKQHTTKEYEVLIELGTDSQEFYPTLYDFLMKRAIEIAKKISTDSYSTNIENTGLSLLQVAVPANQFINLALKANRNNIVFYYYKHYFTYLLNNNMIPTIILTELDKADYISSISYTFRKEKSADFLQELNNKYAGNPTSVEIIDAIAKTLLQSQNPDYEKIYNLCEQGIKKYPDYKRTDILRNRINSLEAPLLQVKASDIYYPDNISVNIRHRNLQSLSHYPELILQQEIGNTKKIIKRIPVNFTSEKKYITEATSINLGKLNPGKYCLSSAGEKNETEFIVSYLTYFSRNNAQHQYEIYVVDRMTGKPVEGATVKVIQIVSVHDADKEQTIHLLKTDKNGFVTFPNEENTSNIECYNRYYYVSYGTDRALEKQNVQPDFSTSYQNENDQNDKINIFVDRSIYRPGQTIYFKAIATDAQQHLKAGKKLEIKLINQNDETIATKTLSTNEFGSVADNFTLPQNGLLGQYQIEIGDKSYSFRVEEYKRPTFEITFDKVDKTFAFGDEVTLKGYAKNFSGVNLEDAQVNYTIVRSPFLFYSRFGGGKKTVNDGVVKTGEDGSFEINFIPQQADIITSDFLNHIYSFGITASVTDINGETQSNTYSLIVGDVSMIINIDAPTQLEKTDTTGIHINAKNLEGIDIDTSGKYAIYALDSNDSIQNKLLEGTFKTGLQTDLKQKLSVLDSGKYRIQLTATDNNGKEAKNEKDIIIFSYKDTKPPIETNEWLVEKNTTFSEKKPAEIIFGVSDQDVYVLYQIHGKNGVLDKQYNIVSAENKTFIIPYKPEYGDQVLLTLTYLKNEKFYNKNIKLKKEKLLENNKLDVKLEVFRDKLRPGQKEQWTISVKDAKQNPIQAEILASMYDASLDKLYVPNQWSFNINQYIENIPSVYYDITLSYDNSYFRDYSLKAKKLYKKPYEYKFDTFNWFGFNLSGRYGLRSLRSKNAIDISDIAENKTIHQESAPAPPLLAGISIGNVSKNKIMPDEDQTSIEEFEQQTPQIRSNFNETAFFYPQLRTNEKGETLITFTVPDSNTRWRFRAFAHNKNVQYSQMEQFVVSRKELMVTPNMPRFVRQGDKTSISVKISNLSEEVISGNAKIEFFDPLTDKSIDLKINSQQPFTIQKDASTFVVWTFDVPQDIELIGCRITASNQTFSDGEQHVLPVLSNRMLVTESMPIDINESGKSLFTFDKLKNNKSNTLNNYRLVFEYANNPAWYAVQALPTMSNPTNENTVSWFAGYYVNTMGASIIKHFPKVSAMIAAWKKQEGDKETLLSKLQKNKELKTVLLEETPWVLEAKDEAGQMNNLSLLFDLNNTSQLTQTAIQKLSELQNSLGGWSWYKGMYPNRSVTQYILYGFAKLQLVGQVEYSSQIKEMQIKALQYIDDKISEDFKNLKKDNEKWTESTTISTTQLEYLYVRSFYRDIPIDRDAHEAERFYTSVVSKNWQSLDLYQRSLLTVILHTNGNKALAQNLAKTIRERSVTDTSNGMYWPNNRSQAFLTMSAVSKHTFLMDALNEVGSTQQEMDAMKQWLVKQKQTQMWESTQASIDAISSLLNYGSNWFADDNNSTISIKVGKQKINTANKELGTDYFKNTWCASEISKDMADVQIDRTSTQPAYGALYWQYFEELDKVSTHKNDALNISKQLFKVGADKSLQSITENSPLKIGDKVVMRLTVRVNNDMEFVQLKDMRAPCFEPVETISGINVQNGVAYYQETKDASTNIFFDHLPKGTYVFEYPVYVNRTGEYANGITTIQSMYAPEFVSHTQGIKVTVK